jgi:hypothetical protein
MAIDAASSRSRGGAIQYTERRPLRVVFVGRPLTMRAALDESILSKNGAFWKIPGGSM